MADALRLSNEIKLVRRGGYVTFPVGAPCVLVPEKNLLGQVRQKGEVTALLDCRGRMEEESRFVLIDGQVSVLPITDLERGET